VCSNLEDSDVQPPQPSDYHGCGPHTQVDYAIATTSLCVILCSIYRKTFGPRSSSFSRQATLASADSQLARWSLLLPQHLRLRPTLTLDLWPATLHLFYNTTLILLHRPRPQTAQDPGSPTNPDNQNDAEICSAAAGVIQSIFESLCEREHLASLWTFSVTALFTAMIQLSVEVRFANPLLAIAAVRRYDSTLYSLRKLAKYWPHAESVLHFFEHSERLQRQNVHVEGSGQGGSPDGLLASPGTSRRISDSRTAAPSPVINASASPNTIFGGPLQIPEVTTPPDLREHTQSGYLDRATSVEETDVAKSWRQLFPFTDTFEAEGAPGAAFLEHWKEAYWQEPFDVGNEFGFAG
jgi:transcriptional regulatory protein AMDR